MDTAKELKDRILTELGYPIIKVELDDRQLTVAVEDSMRWYNTRKGVIDQIQIFCTSGQSEYYLEPQVIDVVEVIREGYCLGFYEDVIGQMGWPLNYFPFMTTGGYSAIVQELQYIGTRNRVLGRDKDWDFTQNWGTGKKGLLRLYPMPQDEERATVIYRRRLAIEMMPYLTPQDQDLIIRYSCARAKFLLGRIRSKYDSLPAAQGDRSLDGRDLLDEAKSEIEQLEKEMQESQEPISFITEGG